MSNKNYFDPNQTEISTDGSKYILSKFEYDLYNDEDNVVEPVIRVKCVNASSRNERWKISEDNKPVFVVEGSKLNKKEREFLRSLEGVSFLISQCKSGVRSFNALRGALKKRLKPTKKSKKA